MSKIRVMIVDDSAIVRRVTREVLEREADIEVVGTAADPLFALDKMRTQWPDVILLDVDMPRMDGLTFLRRLMAERPTPVVICASPDESGPRSTVAALAAGAVGFLTKPASDMGRRLHEAAAELVHAVRAAAGSNLRNARPAAAEPAAKIATDAVIAARAAPATETAATTAAIAAIGTSTGGTQALETVLSMLPAASPGIVVVQHMPEKFTALFAQRLNSLCRVEVREACNGDLVTAGRALIAPGGRHMLLRRAGAQYSVAVIDGPPVNRHKPSVDVLFRSVAQVAGTNALGIIMTGMGDDGAQGLREMRAAGARTLAQDEASSVVFGMPREAIKLGGVDKVVPLELMAREILAFAPQAPTAP